MYALYSTEGFRMKLVTSELMRSIDSKAINESKIPSLELMENAGLGIAQAIISDIVLDYDSVKFSIFCGKGNNGGDGFVIGRHLYQAGYDVEFYYVGPNDKQSEDCKHNFELIQKLNLDTSEVSSIENLPEILDSDFIIDAIFGTGFEGAPRGITAELIAYINEQPQEIISIDMPSGLNADNGQCEGEVIVADYTYTLAQPKYGLYLSPGREL
ncbi:MAG: NAD(P)H-hydrate epimerase, partial [Calditrichaeota bacterium]